MNDNVCPFCGESPIFAIPANDALQGPGRQACCKLCGAKGPWKRLAKDAFSAFSHPAYALALAKEDNYDSE